MMVPERLRKRVDLRLRFLHVGKDLRIGLLIMEEIQSLFQL